MTSGFDFSAFIAGFQEEAEERLQSIEATLVELEKGRGDPEELESLRRDAHSVKGSANMLQLLDIGETAHVLEDTFAYLRDGQAVSDQAHLNFMFELLDNLRTRIGNADDPEAAQLDPDRYRQRLESLDSEAPAGPEATDQEAPDQEAPDQEASAREAPEQAEAPGEAPGTESAGTEPPASSEGAEPETEGSDEASEGAPGTPDSEAPSEPEASPGWEEGSPARAESPAGEGTAGEGAVGEESDDGAEAGGFRGWTMEPPPEEEGVPDSEGDDPGEPEREASPFSTESTREEGSAEPGDAGGVGADADGEDPGLAGEDEAAGAEEPEEPGSDSAGAEAPDLDWGRFIPGVREEALPILQRAEIALAGEVPEDRGPEEVVSDLSSLAASLRQVDLPDAGEAVELVGDVLGTPAGGDLPDSFQELLKGVLDRVRKRLDEAEGPGGTPLDRDRIRKARDLLGQWGMLGGSETPEADTSAPETEVDKGPERKEQIPVPSDLPDLEDEEESREDGEELELDPGFDVLDEGPGEGAEPESETASAGPAAGEGPEAGEAGDEEPAGAEEAAGAPAEEERSGGGAPGSGMDLSAFLDGFQGEARENLDFIQQGLLSSEREEADEEILNQMAQRAHSLKGSANMLGLTDLGEGAEILEDGFVRLRSGELDRRGFDALLGLHDAYREAVDQIKQESRTKVDAAYWRRRMEEGEEEAPTEASGEAPPAGEEASAPSQDESGPRQAQAPATGGTAKPWSSAAEGETTGAAQGEASRQRKTASSQGSLRVSANRLERLSESVIGLAMDRATQEDRRAEIEQINSHLREIRRQWEWFENILPSTGPLVEQRDKLSQQIEEVSQQVNQFRQEAEYDTAARHALYDEIHQRVMDLMVSPLGTIFSVLPRSARDLAQRFQKRVELSIEGSEIELERKNVDALLDPLVHLVTNAISHGIEDPEEREKAGKGPVGNIKVEAEHVGGEVAISVSDDGRGIDYEKVRETAIRTGVTTAAEAENMLPYDLLQMLFRPGFSTKEEVGQISGRGIGMNSVRETVQRMTGSIQVDSEVGEGTTFTLNIPVSTAVQRILRFRVGRETYGVLANQVERIMTLNEAIVTEERGQRFCEYAGNFVPVTWLSELFNTGDEEIYDTKSLRLVVVRHLEGYIGFVVHEVLEESQAVVKDVTNYLRRHAAQGLIGTTISGSGEVQLLLEPTGIKEMERTSPLTLHAGERGGEDPLQGLRVLLVEDSPLARQMEKAVLESVGMEVDTAVDGLDALDRMEVKFPDIVISDIEMPRMDGYDLLRKLRDDDRYRALPVFVVTSRESQEDRDTAHRLGADGFLNKLDLQSGDLIEEIRGRLEHLYA